VDVETVKLGIRRRRGRSPAAGLALLALAGLAGCGGADRSRASGSLVLGLRSDFGGINPITSSDLYTGELIRFALFTPLVRYDAALAVSPGLAASWSEEGDTAVTFALRRDLRWHDGVPVTAQDVAFTFERAKAPESASLVGQAFLPDVARAEVLDSFTVRFVYGRPHAQALEDFWWAPAPRHLLENVPVRELRNAPFNREPVGNGPFRFVEWRPGDRLVLEANPAYPAALGGPPLAQRVVVRTIPDPATLMAELLTGRIHAAIPVLPEQTGRIASAARLRLIAYPGRTLYYIGWNHEKGPFGDARVRRALALAIDRQAIIAALLEGQGVVANGPIPPGSPVYPHEVAPLEHSLSQATDLLEEAGWRDRDGDGIREEAKGRPLRFSLLASDDPLRRAVVEVLQSQLRAAGAAAEIRVAEFQAMIEAHRTREFDAIFTNWILDNFRVAAAPFALLHSSQADVPRSANRSSVRDPELDRLIEAGGAATDPAEQRRIWQAFTERILREQPLTFMFWLNELAGVDASVTGVEMDPRGWLLSLPRWAPAR
jgi:peptide/nickel transport system substrate-binding protein